MKKLISAVLVLLCISSLTGCGIKGKEVLYIEFNEWKMQAVMSNDTENAKDERELVIAVGGYDELYPDVKIVDITLTANQGNITLVDSTNNKTYNGTYKIVEETSKEITYEIIIDGVTGYATLSPTKYYNGTEVPTLPINFGEYSLYFTPNEPL